MKLGKVKNFNFKASLGYIVRHFLKGKNAKTATRKWEVWECRTLSKPVRQRTKRHPPIHTIPRSHFLCSKSSHLRTKDQEQDRFLNTSMNATNFMQPLRDLQSKSKVAPLPFVSLTMVKTKSPEHSPQKIWQYFIQEWHYQMSLCFYWHLLQSLTWILLFLII